MSSTPLPVGGGAAEVVDDFAEPVRLILPDTEICLAPPGLLQALRLELAHHGGRGGLVLGQRRQEFGLPVGVHLFMAVRAYSPWAQLHPYCENSGHSHMGLAQS